MAVVGVGRLGRHHARILAALGDVKLVAVVDVDAERAREVGSLHGALALSDTRELLGKVDAVTVAVPTALHLEVGSVFLAAGIPTFVEKPLAATVAQGEELVRLALEHRVVLQVGHSERFNPALKAARGLITRPGFIEAHRLAPFDERGTDVDVVLDLMIHDIDLVLNLTGEEPASVHAVGVPVISGEVDIANVRLEFPSGAVANLTASRVSREKIRKIRCFEPDTYVSIDTALRRVDALKLERVAGERPRLKASQISVEDSEPLVDELKAFRDAARGLLPPPVSGDEGLAALRVAERIREAIADHARRRSSGAQKLA